MSGDALRRRLLQRLVGEQPVSGIVELRRGPAPQQRRFHQNSGPFTETLTRRGDIGDQCGIGEPQVSDFAQRLLADGAAQVLDVVEPKIYDGLTPVTITL
ncbi:hypothetical protein MGALJ_05270 [Mycobacterium gallinarum]|uniref:Uncharacterized protein n=1 Tax=Mycobacterium gallinarum TaxID=39689 RepID=A0A9W4B6E2_9MYCO|nr:hypothetical protein MGALJ_05270 [Mycobacterium gallinarum]